MDLNTQKSRFSLAHIEAVASHAGFQVEEVKVDRDSHIHFPLPLKNYNDLRLEAINPYFPVRITV